MIPNSIITRRVANKFGYPIDRVHRGYTTINNNCIICSYSFDVSRSSYSITSEIGRRSIVYINRYEIKSLAIDITRFIDQQVANVDPRARCPEIKSTQTLHKHANASRGCVN